MRRNPRGYVDFVVQPTEDKYRAAVSRPPAFGMDLSSGVRFKNYLLVKDLQVRFSKWQLQ